MQERKLLYQVASAYPFVFPYILCRSMENKRAPRSG